MIVFHKICKIWILDGAQWRHQLPPKFMKCVNLWKTTKICFISRIKSIQVCLQKNNQIFLLIRWNKGIIGGHDVIKVTQTLSFLRNGPNEGLFSIFYAYFKWCGFQKSSCRRNFIFQNFMKKIKNRNFDIFKNGL